MSASVFHILLALANGAKHGLGIADDVEEATGEDTRRRHYRLTRAGREALDREAERYRRVVAALAERDVLSGEQV